MFDFSDSLPSRRVSIRNQETLIDIQSVLRGDTSPAKVACLVSMFTRDYPQVSRCIGTYLRRRLGLPTSPRIRHRRRRASEQSVELGVDFVGD